MILYKIFKSNWLSNDKSNFVRELNGSGLDTNVTTN
jgi:hypothetical protein